jgi:hypothetical protein
MGLDILVHRGALCRGEASALLLHAQEQIRVRAAGSAEGSIEA